MVRLWMGTTVFVHSPSALLDGELRPNWFLVTGHPCRWRCHMACCWLRYWLSQLTIQDRVCSGFLAECLVVGLEDAWAFLPVPCCLSSVRLHTCGIDSSARSMDALPLAILHPYISWAVSLSELLGFRVAPRYTASLLCNLMFLPFRSTDFAGCCCLVVVVQQHASVSQGCCLLVLLVA